MAYVALTPLAPTADTFDNTVAAFTYGFETIRRITDHGNRRTFTRLTPLDTSVSIPTVSNSSSWPIG